MIIIAMSGEMPTYLGQYVTGSISYTAALITRIKKRKIYFSEIARMDIEDTFY